MNERTIIVMDCDAKSPGGNLVCVNHDFHLDSEHVWVMEVDKVHVDGL